MNHPFSSEASSPFRHGKLIEAARRGSSGLCCARLQSAPGRARLRRRIAVGMSDETSTTSPTTPEHRYDAALAQEIETSWQDRWEADGTFHTPNPAGPLGDADLVERRGEKLFVQDMFPYPSGRGPPRRPPAGFHRDRCLLQVQADDRPQRALHDGLRRVRSARRAVRRADRHAPGDHDRRQHRQHAPPAQAPRTEPRHPSIDFHDRPVVLPMDAVDLQPDLQRLVRRRPGQRRARSTSWSPSSSPAPLDARRSQHGAS